jgi:small subunit ribosomal protein S6
MRIYENLFIVKPDAPDEEVGQFIEQMRGVVANAGGTVDKAEIWAKRRLAYKVGRYREGTYVLFQYSAGPETVKEFERRLRVADLVIKYITVRIDETLKRLEKRRKEREQRAARRPVPPPAAMPASPAPEMPGAPLPGMPVEQEV